LATRDIVLIGGSAGSVAPLRSIVASLGGLHGAVLVVVHMSPEGLNRLVPVLNGPGGLPAKEAADGDAIAPGMIVVAVPNRHLLVADGRLRLGDGPRENRARPAIDPLFRTAAKAYGPRVVGVLLSGRLDDGTHGLAVIKAFGGVAVVQDPLEAKYPSMPRSAIDNVDVDHVLCAKDIGPLLLALNKESTRATLDERSRLP